MFPHQPRVSVFWRDCPFSRENGFFHCSQESFWAHGPTATRVDCPVWTKKAAISNCGCDIVEAFICLAFPRDCFERPPHPRGGLNSGVWCFFCVPLLAGVGRHSPWTSISNLVCPVSCVYLFVNELFHETPRVAGVDLTKVVHGGSVYRKTGFNLCGGKAVHRGSPCGPIVLKCCNLQHERGSSDIQS